MSKLYKLQLRHGSYSLSEGPGVVGKNLERRVEFLNHARVASYFNVRGPSVLKASALNMEDLRFSRKIFLYAHHEQPMVFTRFEARRVIFE
ncbi:hypothetical protein EMIT0P171_30283 [Pseudomonas sp. IT-P171]